MGTGDKRVNTVQKIYTLHKCKKLYLLKLLQEWGGIKENSREDEFKYDIFDAL
jgi:hypothetical protein